MAEPENRAAEGDRIVVAVRLRPCINPESNTVLRADRSHCCVRINQSTCEMVDPRTSQLRGRFTFDKCFDSFDASDADFAGQERVFSELAPPLLRGAMDGFNITVFAYGQTASGKSYTMLGTHEQPGFIPRFVQGLFEECAAASRSTPGAECTVEASYLEIHMEQIRDLLNPTRAAARKGGLRVREHPRTGPYVEDLAKVACSSSEEVQMLLAHGNTIRTVGATQLNVESSRSHAIFTLKLTQRTPLCDAEGGVTKLSEKVSRVHLVDLAGSERAKRSGGHRLQETGAINKSLSTLGAVIAALAAGRQQHVPYRESALTYLLKDGLGGNARTVMLAAISPMAVDFNETVSTLRYADSAKRIVNHATPNLDASEKLVDQLKGEIESLRSQLAGGTEAEVAAVREQLALSEKLMAEAQMSWQQKLRHAESLAEQRMAMVATMEEQMAALTERLAQSERQRAEAEEERQRLAEQLSTVSTATAGGSPVAVGGVGRRTSHENGGGAINGGTRGVDWDDDAEEEGHGDHEDHGEEDEGGSDEMPAEFSTSVRGGTAGRRRSSAASTPDVPRASEIWYSLLDDEGDEYYWDPATGVTTWYVPQGAVVLPAAPSNGATVAAAPGSVRPTGSEGGASAEGGLVVDGGSAGGESEAEVEETADEARERQAAEAVARALSLEVERAAVAEHASEAQSIWEHDARRDFVPSLADSPAAPTHAGLVIAQGESDEEEVRGGEEGRTEGKAREAAYGEAGGDDEDDEMPSEFRTVTTTRRLSMPRRARSMAAPSGGTGGAHASRRASDGAMLARGSGRLHSLFNGGMGSGGAGGGVGQDDVESDAAIDGNMLARTLSQVAQQQRTLGSLKVQLAQAEQMRDAQLARDPDAAPRRSKWVRNVVTLHAAVAMLAPTPEWMHPRPSAHERIESCLIDGWLLRRSAASGGGSGTWRRCWHCLRPDGLLVFNDATDGTPCAFVALGPEAAVEVEGTGMPQHAFGILPRKGGTIITFLCDSPGGGSTASDEWVQALRVVISAAGAGGAGFVD